MLQHSPRPRGRLEVLLYDPRWPHSVVHCSLERWCGESRIQCLAVLVRPLVELVQLLRVLRVLGLRLGWMLRVLRLLGLLVNPTQILDVLLPALTVWQLLQQREVYGAERWWVRQRPELNHLVGLMPRLRARTSGAFAGPICSIVS